jgi:hypothetical protein
VIFFFSTSSFSASSLRQISGMWSQSVPACDLILVMNVILAPLKRRLSIGCLVNWPSPNSMYTASNLPFGERANDATLPITLPYSFLIGLPIERKRLEVDISVFYPPALSRSVSLLWKQVLLAFPVVGLGICL